MKLSIYTSAYKLDNNLFDWKFSLYGFSNFADEVIVATTTDCKDNTIKLLQDYCLLNDKIKLIITDIKFNDYSFDGKLKNAALKECSKDFCILLDLDEEIPVSTRQNWEIYCHTLSQPSNFNIDGLMIASINLYKDIYHYKDIGYKFYLHKNFRGIERGIVDFAKLDNGKMDIKKSDTTEPIINGKLANFIPLSNKIEDLQDNNIPYVFHYWCVDLNKRLQQNQFWKPHWENRAGKEVNDIILEEKGLLNYPYLEHNLPFL